MPIKFLLCISLAAYIGGALWAALIELKARRRRLSAPPAEYDELWGRIVLAKPEDRERLALECTQAEINRLANDWRPAADMCGNPDGEVNGLGMRRWENL